MQKYTSSIFTFVLILGAILATKSAFSINLSDKSFYIIDIPKSSDQHGAFENVLRYPNTGLSINLELDQENNSLVAKFDNAIIPFETLAKRMIDALAGDSSKLIPMLIDFNGPSVMLKEAFIKTGLNNSTHYQPRGERWCDVEDMIASNKRIIVFTFQRIHQGNQMFHYIWNYVADFPKSISETPYFDGNYSNGDLENELLMVRDYISPYREQYPKNTLSYESNQNPYYLSYMINCWNYTGKKPNLFLIPNNLRAYSDILNKLDTYQHLKGTVEFQGKPLEKVLWKHSERNITYGYFSFPFIEGEELILSPYSPGFSFTPENIVINMEGNIRTNISFSAKPLQVNERLTGYYPFDKSLNNMVEKSKPPINRNAQIIPDVERGNVLKLPDQSYLILGKPEDFKINGSSFTISTWLKLADVTKQWDYCIVGTQETSFRKGLHLLIRDKRPYFGFFGNDLWSDFQITPEKWYHVVFRYNIYNGEQAIYVNGQMAGSSLNHASFIGETDLLIGHGLKQVNFMNGYVDELCIWNRPLGEEEIQTLFAENAKLIIQKPFNYLVAILILTLVALLLIATLYRQHWLRNKTAKHPPLPEGRKEEPNSIYLFGNFCVVNRDGINITAQFTPKIKELFLLILTQSFQRRKGISTERLTEHIWAGKTKREAANNRSVSMNKLRKITQQLQGLHVVFEDGRWMLEIDEPTFCDYKSVLEIIRMRTLKQDHYLDLFRISSRGVFLANSNFIWLDEAKGQMVNEVIDLLLKFAENLNPDKHNALLEAVVQRILMADDLNENALRFQLALLVKRDSKHLAQFTFKQFQQNYKQAYNETYPLSFNDFINGR